MCRDGPLLCSNLRSSASALTHKVMVVVAVLVVVLVALGEMSAADPPDELRHYPGFTPIAENCTQSLVELLLLRQEVHLSHLLTIETSVAETLTTLSQTVTELRDAVKAGQEVQQTLREECTAPWSAVGANCLLFAIGERRNWVASRQFCAGRGGDLATFSDANTYVEYLDYIKSVNTENKAVGAWVGGSDEEVEGVWQWVTGEDMPKGPPFWGSTNGYQAEPSGGRGENCVVLHHPDKYYLHDITCGYAAAPLCQKGYK